MYQKPLLVVVAAILFMSFRKKTPSVSKSYITLFNGKQTLRGCDGGGCGDFGARRDNGTREHLGLDILCEPTGNVFSPFNGTVIDTVDPYGNGKFSGLKIKVDETVTIKIMYFSPLQNLKGQTVTAGQLIGKAQNVQTKYPKVQPHLHIEFFKNGARVDPKPYLF